MNALILETSTEKSCIVLTVDGVPVAVKSMNGGPELSKTLALEVKNILSGLSFCPDFIAVGTGPGSYTGVRVGASLAKSLAFGWQVPLVGFCSLIAFSPQYVPIVSPWAVLVDARMGGFYVLKDSCDSAVLRSPSEAEADLKNFSLLASPHPDLIKKRLALPGKWVETFPDPDVLAATAHRLSLKRDLAPLVLSYLAP